MIKEYTHVKFQSGRLKVRGFDENGNRVNETVDFCPTLWVKPTFDFRRWKRYIKSTDITSYSDIMGEKMVALTFKSIRDAEVFLSDNSKYDPIKCRQEMSPNIWDAPRNRYESQYMAECFPLEMHCDIHKMRVVLFDIETETGHRNVPDDTIVSIRKKAEKGFLDDGVNGTVKKIPIIAFESLPEQSTYEILNEETGVWVNYNSHPYRFIGGFPDPEKATEKIILITAKVLNEGMVYTWGLNDFKHTRSDLLYTKCETEAELLEEFLGWFRRDYPDIFAGYNSSAFDNLYLANRIKNVLGEEKEKELSPYGKIRQVERKDPKTHNYVKECEFDGISCLDYLKMYKKWGCSSQRESFKLDSVGEDEVGVKKVENPTGGTFRDFYTGLFDIKQEPNEDAHEIAKLGYKRTQLRYKLESNPELREEFDKLNDKIIRMCQQLFVEYNIRDVELVELIEKKLHLFDVCTAIAYLAHENFVDAFSPVHTWDLVIYNHLRQRNVVIPHDSEKVDKTEKYEGAYVKPPILGKHEYCLSFDLDSLYPHLIMQYNISPDTVTRDNMRKVVKVKYNTDKLIQKEEDTSFAHSHNYSIGASGVAFRRDKQGILPYLCEHLYSSRKANKKMMLKNKSEHEKIVIEMRKRGIL